MFDTIFQINENHIDSEFVRLAELILLKKELNVNEDKFGFTEIEFYYYSPSHPDAFTHPHEYPAGKWRFHSQGFDITLRGNKGFGGILVRGIEYKGKYINGPRRVLYKVMESLSSVSDLENRFGLQDRISGKLRIFRTFRHGLKRPFAKLECTDVDYYRHAPYRFIINPHLFSKSHFKGAEKIARSFNDKTLSREFLGYTLRS